MFFKSAQGGGASNKFHKAMKSCIKHVTGVTSELTSSGIRVSAADQIDQHPILNISGKIVYGGCSFEGKPRLFYHITKIFYVSQARLVLVNNADPNKLCPMYSID